MWNKILTTSLVLFLMSCNQQEAIKVDKENKEEYSVTAKSELSGNYLINTEKTVMKWEGAKLASKHDGIVKLSKGTVEVKNGLISGGVIEVDLTSIQALDLEGEQKEKLEKHLKNEDFFDVKNYPQATLKILAFSGERLSADLTIKGKTKTIEFPMKFTITETELNASAKMLINRTDWGIVYGSGTFMDVAKDKVISDEIKFEITLVAEKKTQ